jgi:purine nucleosidase
VNIIVDNDMASDVDNAVAIAVLCWFLNKGKANLLAYTVADSAPYSAPCTHAMLAYSGYGPDKTGAKYVPLGSNKTSPKTTDAAFAQTVAATWGYGSETINSYPNPVPVLRQALVSSTGSVTIVAAGPLSNMSALLGSPADGISPLTGAQLITQKVARLVIMGGTWPTSNGTAESNYAADPTSTQNVLENWPGEIVGCGNELGNNILVAPRAGVANTADPFKQAFSLYSGGLANGARQAWDPATFLFALMGGFGMFYRCGGLRGSATIDVSGNNTFVPTTGTPGNISFLRPQAGTSYSDMALAISNLLWSISANPTQ